jgi:hypothetical protein
MYKVLASSRETMQPGTSRWNMTWMLSEELRTIMWTLIREVMMRIAALGVGHHHPSALNASLCSRFKNSKRKALPIIMESLDNFVERMYKIMSVLLLCSMFQVCTHPDPRVRQELGRKVGLGEWQVRFWFQNRRSSTKVSLHLAIVL